MKYFSHYMAFLLGSATTSIAVRLNPNTLYHASDIGFPITLALIAVAGLIYSFGRK